MGILKRITALAISAAIMCTAVNTVFAENNNGGDTVNIKIDGSKRKLPLQRTGYDQL